jgi:diguanylate cyclase (GGDEF)-like protein/PAS domain S-box-containing protein
MTLDIRTLSILLSLASFLQVLALFIQYRINRTYSGTGWWAVGTALLGLGFILNALRDQAGIGPFAIVSNNLCFLLGTSLCYIGILRFQGQQRPLRWIISIVIASTLIAAFFTFFQDNLAVRRVNVSFSVAVILLSITWQLFSHTSRGLNLASHFLGSIFLVTALFFVLRGLSPLGGPFIEGMFDPSAIQEATYLVLFAATTLWTFGFIILVNQRLNIENREAREHFEEIFNTSPDAVLITRVSDGRIVEINQGLSAMTGYSRADIIGKTTIEANIYHSPADRQRLLNALRSDGHCENLDFTFQRKDGSLLQGILSAKVVKLQGSPHILSVTRDISERIQIEKDLQASRDQINRLLQATDQGIYGLDRDGHCTFINRSALSMLGFTQEECAGQDMHTLIHHSYPDGRPYPAQDCPIGLARLTGVGCRLDNEVLWRKDGSRMFAEYSAHPTYQDGQISGAVVTFSDITARKVAEQALQESEQRYRLLADQANDVIWTMSLEGRFTYVSPSVLRLRGYTADEVLQQSLPEAICPGSIPTVQAGFAAAFQEIQTGSSAPPQYFEIEQPCKDGSSVWTEATARVMYDKEHRPLGLVGVTRDITERRRLQAKLEEQATKDGLTGINNRRRFLELANNEIKRAQRLKHPLALALIDLDHFKHINDAYGHAAGDQVLQGLTSICLKNIREIDIFARFGGDEFVLLLPETTAGQARAVIERVRGALESHPLVYNQHNLRITLSSGITALSDGAEVHFDLLLEQADQALYQAKEAGRNCVMLHPSRVHG